MTGLRLTVLLLLVIAAPARAQERPIEKSLDAAVAAGKLDGLHSVLVWHRGTVVAERHYPGTDWRWGRSLGRIEPTGDSLHDLRSVTKSITSLLYGIALAEGKVPPPEAPLLAQFPDYADLAGDPLRDAITVGDALSMQMGTEWDENRPYTDSRNSEVAMEMAPDRYRFVLGRPMREAPGRHWIYNGGATALIGGLIARGTGRTLDAYAREKLFTPLGIARFDWIKGNDGVPSAASGLRLGIRDLARIGIMVARGGRWQGRQIVPADWLERSFEPLAAATSGLRYGYFWWLASGEGPPTWMAGFGNGGQRLTIAPNEDLVVAVFAGNYNKPEAWKVPVAVILEHVVPTLGLR